MLDGAGTYVHTFHLLLVVLYRENYIGFVPSTQNHGNWTFTTEEYGRNPAGEDPSCSGMPPAARARAPRRHAPVAL